MRLVDAARCPYCARVRIALAEKNLAYEPVAIDLNDRPQWLLELNPPAGRVPVLDDDGLELPESEVILAYLEERNPEPPLLPADPVERARARLLGHRFDQFLGGDYYAFRRGEENDLQGALERLAPEQSLWVAVFYAPWVIRARAMLGLELPARLQGWLGELALRPAFAAEIELVERL